MRIIFTFFICLCWSVVLLGQDYLLTGIVKDEAGKPLSGVTVAVRSLTIGTNTNNNGYYELKVPDQKTIVVEYSFIGYETQKFTLSFYKDKLAQNVILKEGIEVFEEISVKGERASNYGAVTRLKTKQVERLPSVTGGVEALIKTLPGVASSNELSSQYSVRGGNFDENLVYVNDFEIYRPFLVRSGQQEGLSFINADLVSSISFSAGGFEAKYGDKLSSVLDIRYKQPKEFGASVALSLLGTSGHIEGATKDRNFTYVLGVRQRSNQYVLNSLKVQGDYKPLFLDFQSFLTFNVNTNWQLQYIGNYSKNRYNFAPNTSVDRIGNIATAKQIRAAFEGQERDEYNTFMSGLGGVFTSDNQKLSLKILSSIFLTSEVESFDIIGEYFIGEVETEFSSEDFGEVVSEYGVGTYHRWARNNLNAVIGNVAFKGFLDQGKHFYNWGLKYQVEDIQDNINEWNRIDSAGFSLSSLDGTFSSGYNETDVELFRVLKSDFNLQSHRLSGFVQDTWSLDSINAKLTGGVRFNYWNINKEFFVTPRFQFSWRPKRWKGVKDTVIEEQFAGNPTQIQKLKKRRDSTDLAYRFAAGLYYQAPFYREMRNNQGEVNTNLKSQKSAQIVAGLDYEFYWSERPFKFTTEAYFKYMWDLVPYDIDNVLIRYFGENSAVGYATGIGFRLNGEFIPGTESWFSLSLLDTKEDLLNDVFTMYFNEDGKEILPSQDSVAYQRDSMPGFLRRPTNQTINFAIFLQDNLPNNENFKAHLNLLFGSPLPYGPPNRPRWRNAISTSPYIRVDLGFSALLFEDGKREIAAKSFLNNFQSIWFAVEVFNLLDNSNVSSYSWINDFTGQYYSVPNRLTSRRINARLLMKF